MINVVFTDAGKPAVGNNKRQTGSVDTRDVKPVPKEEIGTFSQSIDTTKSSYRPGFVPTCYACGEHGQWPKACPLRKVPFERWPKVALQRRQAIRATLDKARPVTGNISKNGPAQ